MVWFNKLKQINVANTNVDLNSATDNELDDLIEVNVPLLQMVELKVFRRQIYNNLFADALRGARVTSKKRKIDLLYTVPAVALAAIEVGIAVVNLLTKQNPAAAEYTKRYIKRKVASW